MAVVYRAIDDVGFEYYARQMYLYDARHNVPTYIIGSGLGSGPIERRSANLLKVWPRRHPNEMLRRKDFKPRIIDQTRRHRHYTGSKLESPKFPSQHLSFALKIFFFRYIMRQAHAWRPADTANAKKLENTHNMIAK